MNPIRVVQNPAAAKRKDQPWLVTCSLCTGQGTSNSLMDVFTAFFGGSGVKGFARDWPTAMRYADLHAAAHAATECPTCHHVPAEPLNEPSLPMQAEVAA